MIRIIICLIIVILLYTSISSTINNTCALMFERIHIAHITGTRIGNIRLADKLGFPTITLRLDHPIPCGFYIGSSRFGQVIVVIGKHDRTKADINFNTYRSDLDKTERFEITDLHRIIANESDMIRTYNVGCCY